MDLLLHNYNEDYISEFAGAVNWWVRDSHRENEN